MRRGGTSDNEGTTRQNGSSHRSRGEQENGESVDEAGMDSDDQQDGNDPVVRRTIRIKYRELLNSIQQDRDEILNETNNKLTEVLQEANELFKSVRQTREAAMDTQLLVVASELGKEKAMHLLADGSTFDTVTFTQHLLTFMGLNRLENIEEDDASGEDTADGYLPSDAWTRVTRRAERCFSRTPTFHYMMGSFHADPPPAKQRIERQRKAPSKETKRIMPTQLKKMGESHQEATEKEVERILGYLKSYFQGNPTTPIPYYEFVINPTSFSLTVENIFHTSFLIRDGLARLYLDGDKLPCIAPVENDDGVESATRAQSIVSINQKMWKELILAYDIKEPMIPEND
ncbi:non-structural maintenance of chromosomes element 4 homolog A [Synchiropus splendidus]|uniref:non-structural maintenance of chromosomes element 4 homolog A n=1 Tax=Synchiropus splendidus TaxID=270530 RepID=UPI00237DA0E6|nr:non-structural maintenance of chromosomes element 4 homolog A [Synchiropus splendidus]